MTTDNRHHHPHRPVAADDCPDHFADVRAYLHTLPQPPLAPTLWPRLRKRRRSQRVAAAAWLAMAAGSAAMALALALSQPEPAPAAFALVPPGTPGSDATGSAAPGPDATRPEIGSVAALHALDRMLQAGYARGASTEQLSPLWQARERLASSSPMPVPAQPVRL